MAYTDAYTNLGIAYSERPPFGATTDSEEVRQFLEKLTQCWPPLTVTTTAPFTVTT